jgi:uncharacterized protein (TIGR00730 family)
MTKKRSAKNKTSAESKKPDIHESMQFDFRRDFSWRIFRIMAEFVEGFQFIANFKQTVSFFGSTRFPDNDHHYKEARRLAAMLAKDGFTIVTGGGPGIMEAANRGAHESGGKSVGMNIVLPREQKLNPYVHRSQSFHYFFTRKVMLDFAAEAYIFFPGGFGTLDEFFEIVTLIQTKKIRCVPVLLVGKDYWGTLINWIYNHVFLQHKAINKEDLAIFQIADSVEEAYRMLQAIKEKPSYA